MKNLVILILVFIIFLIINSKTTSGFTNENIQVVVSVYNEDMDWVAEEPFSGLDIICYHKGDKEIPSCNAPNCKIEKIPNVGRCDHTYLYHIIEKYDNLAPVTLFIPGSWKDPRKHDRTLEVLNKVHKTGETYIPSDPAPSDLYGFQIDYWESTNDKNKEKNVTSNMLPSPQRPFGVWMQMNLPDRPINKVQYSGVFAVSREDIRKNSIDFYKNLIKYVDSDSNPEAGHYIERAWYAIFHPNG